MLVRHRPLLGLLLILPTVAFTADGFAKGQATNKKRAAPPKFDAREVEQIFFPDARKQLIGARPTGLRPANTDNPGGAIGPAPPPRGTAGSPTTVAKAAWPQLISAETLADEVKVYQPLLAGVVKTPSQFKGNGARNARKYFSTVATMMAIIAQYEGDIRWKNQAAAARELFARAGFNSKSDNDNAYHEAKLRSEDLAALLRGETLPTPPNIEPNPSFDQQVSNRPPLMWRLERAEQDRLAVWTADPREFNKNLDAIKHEAEIVAALAQVIQHPSYTDADSNSYLEYAKELQKAALEIREAVKQKNAEAARIATSNMSKACSNCHGDFRGE
jgi:hypothetical protein